MVYKIEDEDKEDGELDLYSSLAISMCIVVDYLHWESHIQRRSHVKMLKLSIVCLSIKSSYILQLTVLMER